eukprot:scaffold4032_cov24-Prasinocladus_malaysianus.AAC.2
MVCNEASDIKQQPCKKKKTGSVSPVDPDGEAEEEEDEESDVRDGVRGSGPADDQQEREREEKSRQHDVQQQKSGLLWDRNRHTAVLGIEADK